MRCMLLFFHLKRGFLAQDLQDQPGARTHNVSMAPFRFAHTTVSPSDSTGRAAVLRVAFLSTRRPLRFCYRCASIFGRFTVQNVLRISLSESTITALSWLYSRRCVAPNACSRRCMPTALSSRTAMEADRTTNNRYVVSAVWLCHASNPHTDVHTAAVRNLMLAAAAKGLPEMRSTLP